MSKRPVTDAAIDELIKTIEAVKGTGVLCYGLVLQGPTGATVSITNVGRAGARELASILKETADSLEDDY